MDLVIAVMLTYEQHLNPGRDEWAVFIHGAGGNGKTWSYQVEQFKPYFNLLLIDLRDHGESKNIQPAYEKYRFEIISLDIKKVLDHLRIESAHFITLSFGSVLLQHFTMQYPGMVKKVILAGAIFRGNALIKSFVYLARMMNKILSYPAMYSLFSYLLMPRSRNQKARRLYQMQARRLTQGEYLKWVGLYQEFFKLLNDFFKQKLTWPTLIIMGSDDFIFLRSAKAFSNGQSHARLEVIPGTGHICNIENPDRFNSLALEFLLVKDL